MITNSWGIYGEPTSPGKVKADEQAFEQAAAQGITVLFSSGDNGDVARSRASRREAGPPRARS